MYWQKKKITLLLFFLGLSGPKYLKAWKWFGLYICQVEVTATTTCLETCHLNGSARFVRYAWLLLVICKWCLGHLRKHALHKQKNILLINRMWRNSLYTQTRTNVAHSAINLWQDDVRDRNSDIYSNTVHNATYLGDVKCLKRCNNHKEIQESKDASPKKLNVLYLLHCCRGILFRKRYPLKDLEEMEQMVACAIPLKFKVAI